MQPIGFVTVVVGFACILLGVRFSLLSLAISSLLGAAAAILLGSSGQVPPAHLLLAFVVPSILCRRKTASAALYNLSFPRPGFWLGFATLFGVASSIFLPRIFAGATQINAVGSTEGGIMTGLIPLAPVSGNITQSIYLVADLACFLAVVGAGNIPNGKIVLAKTIIILAVSNIIFAIADIITFYTGTSILLEPFRNAQYTMHFDEMTFGMKRIVGSFTETSSFSGVTIGILGFVGTLWLYGRWSTLTGLLSLVSLCLIILSTSSTGILGGALLVVLLYVTSLSRFGRGKSVSVTAFVLGVPVLVIIALGITSLNSSVYNSVSDYLNTTLFDKSTSQSGMERASWNAAAIQNVIDTVGLGTGLGSVRSSSFLLAVPANLGLPGVILFAGFFWQALFRANNKCTNDIDVNIAARNGCFGLLFAAVTSGALVDLGLQFYFLAGIASTAVVESYSPKIRVAKEAS